MLTEQLAASPHARDPAAPSCPVCAAGKPAARWEDLAAALQPDERGMTRHL